MAHNTTHKKEIIMTDRKRKIDLGVGGGGAASSSSAAKWSKDQADGENDVNPWTGAPFSARYHSILTTRKKLPVYQFKDQLIECVKENQIVVVEGETGSG